MNYKVQINDQITDSVTQMIKHTYGVADNLSTLLTILQAFQDKNDAVKAGTWQGLSAQDKEMIMSVSGSASTAMMYTEQILREKNGG